MSVTVLCIIHKKLSFMNSRCGKSRDFPYLCIPVSWIWQRSPVMLWRTLLQVVHITSFCIPCPVSFAWVHVSCHQTLFVHLSLSTGLCHSGWKSLHSLQIEMDIPNNSGLCLQGCKILKLFSLPCNSRTCTGLITFSFSPTYLSYMLSLQHNLWSYLFCRSKISPYGIWIISEAPEGDGGLVSLSTKPEFWFKPVHLADERNIYCNF